MIRTIRPVRPVPERINENGWFKDMPYPNWHENPAELPGLAPEALKLYQPAIDGRMRKVYGWRRISLHPYERWSDMFIGRMQAQVCRWAPVLNNLTWRKGLDITDGGDTGSKAKDVNSQYPNASIDPSEEAYASQADDHVKHEHSDLGQMEGFAGFDDPKRGYRDPVTAIVDSMGVLFSRLVN